MEGGGRTVTADLQRDTDKRKADYKLQTTNYKTTNYKLQNYKLQNYKLQNYKLQTTKLQTTKLQTTKLQTTNYKTTNYKTTNYKVRVLAAPVPKSQIGSEGLRSPENVALRTKPERKLGNCNLDNITTDASPQ